jgi:hypothetical protein
VGAVSFQWDATVDVLRDRYMWQSGPISSEGVVLNRKTQSTKCGQGLTNRNLNDSSLKCVTHEAIILRYDVQGVVCQSAPQDQPVKGAALQVSECSATYVVQLMRSVQDWMEIRSFRSSYLIQLQPSRAFSSTGGGKCYYTAPNPNSPDLNPCDYDPIPKLK